MNEFFKILNLIETLDFEIINRIKIINKGYTDETWQYYEKNRNELQCLKIVKDILLNLK